MDTGTIEAPQQVPATLDHQFLHQDLIFTIGILKHQDRL
jgi:hypothetical protein